MKRRYIALVIAIVISSLYLQLTSDKTSGSSYSYKPGGVRAFFSLLQQLKVPVEAWLYPFSELSLDDKNQTMVVVNARHAQDTEKLISWVKKGNSLVIIGEMHLVWDSFNLESSIYQSKKKELLVNCNSSTNYACRDVKQISGLYKKFNTYNADEIDVIVGNRAEAFVSHKKEGLGEIWFISDAKIITNDQIDKNDNLRFLFQIITRNQKIYFDEFHHGFFAPTEDSKKQSFETAKIFIISFVIILILITLSRAIRFGPPNPEIKEKAALGTEFASVLGLLYFEHQAKVLENYISAWKARTAKKYALSKHASTKQIISELQRKKLIEEKDYKSLNSAISTLKYSQNKKKMKLAVNELERVISDD